VTTEQPGSADDTDGKSEQSPNGAVKELIAVPVHAHTATREEVDSQDTASDPATFDHARPSGDFTDDAAESAESEADPAVQARRRIGWKRVLIFGVLPGLALLLASGAGYLKWLDSSRRDAQIARVESVQVAKDSTVALLSYRPDTVEKDLGAATSLVTGEFKNSYASLTNDVVIPGAKQKRISAAASVPAAASVSANPTHAVVIVFVDQTVVVGTDAPTETTSSVKVTLDNVGGRWLISQFDPV
jgi:Mce-associated membrane protein